MTDWHSKDYPSTDQPVVKWSETWWATKANPTARRCTAHRKNGDRCGKAAMEGQRVCGTHGGRAPQAKRAARRRIEESADRMARELLKMAVDDNVSDTVKLAALRDLLDRAGVSAKTSVEVDVAVKPYEQIFDETASVESGSRAEFRRSIGREDHTTPALAESVRAIEPVESNAPIDAEFMDLGDELIAAMRSSVYVSTGTPPATPEDAQHAPDECTEPGMSALGGPLGPTGPAAGLMPLTKAVSAMAEMRRDAARHRNPPTVQGESELRTPTAR